MKITNKLLAVLMAVCIFILPLVMNVNAAGATRAALPLSAGLDALRGQFKTAVADESDGYALDYAYYSPAGKNDTKKYF